MVKVSKIFLIGPMGSGKSTIGRALSKQLSFKFYDADAVIVERSGAEISWIFDIEGETGFRLREQRVMEELMKKNNVVIATGGGSVTNAKNRSLLSSQGYVIYLQASIAQQLSRIQRDGKYNRPLIRDAEDPKVVLERLSQIREPLYRELADLILDTDRLTVKAIVKKITDSF